MPSIEEIHDISVQLQQGLTKESIASNLLQKGWKLSDIDNVFFALDESVTNTNQNSLKKSVVSPVNNRDIESHDQMDMQKSIPNHGNRLFVLVLILFILFGLLIFLLNRYGFSTYAWSRNGTIGERFVVWVSDTLVHPVQNTVHVISGAIKPSPTPLPSPIKQPKALGSNVRKFQLVNNVGYSFYITQIDYPNAPP